MNFRYYLNEFPAVIFKWYNPFSMISLIKESYKAKYKKECDENLYEMKIDELDFLIKDLDVYFEPEYFLLYLN